MLELKNITKVYDPGTVTETTLFKNFNLTVQDGQFVSVVGSNGSGKTSLLNIICGSLPVEGGSVSIGGRNITKVKEFRRHTRIG
ncbi:MAG: ATP-binding cassette domain-containing protein, partial [Clostridiales bacterium]|nr:ATP-binding cassette domain-containing protein [Clostridiales bacterium]